MENISQNQVIAVSNFSQKVTDYNQLVKTRLTFLVVLSAVITYATAAFNQGIVWFDMFILIIGGTLVTGSSNGINQIIEKNLRNNFDTGISDVSHHCVVIAWREKTLCTGTEG